MAIDLDTAIPLKQNEFGAIIKSEPINLDTAKPVQSLQSMIGSHPEAELKTSKSERYVRPLTDLERDQSAAELITRQQGKETPLGVKISQKLETPEARAIEGGVLTMGFSPMLDAIRGVTSASVPETDVWNMVIDSAKKSILEPATSEPTSVSVLKAYPKMDWRVAGVLGTIAEIGFTTNMIEEAGKIGADALSRDTQFSYALNRIRTTPQWNESAAKLSEKIGVPLDEVKNQMARKLWDIRNDADYWTLLRGNIANSIKRVPIGLSVEDVSGVGELGEVAKGLPSKEERGDKIVKAMVRVGSKTAFGATHEEALNKLQLSKEDSEEGKDFQAFLVDDKGNQYTRQQSSLLFGVGQSSEIEKQGTPAAKARMTKARKEIEEQQTAAKAQFVKARIDQLQGESDNIWQKIKLFGEEREKLEKANLSLGRIPSKIEDLVKKANATDDQMRKLYLGDTMVSDIKNELLQFKAKDLMKEQDAIESESLKQGTLEGKLAERERWQLKTEKEKKEQLEREQRQSEKKRINKEIKKMASDIQGLPTKNLPIEYKDKIEEIKSNFDFKNRSDKTLSRRESMQDFVARQLEQGNEINIPTEKLDLIHRVPLNEMTYQDVKDVHEAVIRLYKNGKLKDRLLTQVKEKKFDDIVKQSVNTITKGEGITPETSIVKALQKSEESIKDQSFHAVRWYILNNMRPELMYNALDGWGQGVMTNTCWDALYHAENGEMLDSDLFQTVIGKAHEKLSMKNLHTRTDVGRFKNMTKNNAMFIYANSFNEGNLDHLYGSGLTDKDIKDVEAFLSTEEKKAVSETIKFFDNYVYPRLSKVYERQEGVHLPKEDNYFPIDRLEDVSYNKELEKDLLERSYIKRPGVTKGFTKARVASSKGFSEFDYFGTIYRHLDKVAHYLNFSEAVRDVNKVLLNPEIKQSITDKFGKDYYDILYKHLKDVAYGKLHNERNLVMQALQFTRQRAAPLYLGYNFLTTAKQLVGFIQGMEMAGKASSLKALMAFARSPKSCLKVVDEESAMMKFRSMRQEREFQEIISNKTWEEKLSHSTGFQWLQEKSLAPTMFVDRVVSNCIWRGAKAESLLKGMSEKNAIAEADRIVRRTQPMGGLIHLPHLFRGGEAEKQISFLKGHTNKLLNLQIEMVGRKKDGNSSNGKFASQLLFYTLIPGVTMYLIEKKAFPDTGKKVVGAIGKQATVSLYGIEDFFSWIESGRYSPTTPIESYMMMVQKLLTSKTNEKKIDSALMLGSGVIGAPYVGAKRLLTGKIFGESEKKEKTGKGQSTERSSEIRERARERTKKLWD